MPVITLEQLKEKFENPPVRNIDELMLWAHRQIAARSADYDTVMSEAHQKTLDGYVGAVPQVELFGQKLGTYQGLSREQIKSLFGLSDASVDTIFAAAGIVE